MKKIALRNVPIVRPVCLGKAIKLTRGFGSLIEHLVRRGSFRLSL